MFGVEIDLDDNEAVRDAVIAWAQQQLVQNFSWGAKIDLPFILVVLEDMMRQDLHKGPLNLVEEVEQHRAHQAAQQAANDMLVSVDAPSPSGAIRTSRRSVRA